MDCNVWPKGVVAHFALNQWIIISLRDIKYYHLLEICRQTAAGSPDAPVCYHAGVHPINPHGGIHPEVTGSDSLCRLLVFLSLFRLFSVKPSAQCGVCFGGQLSTETKVLLAAAHVFSGGILDQLTAFSTSRHFILPFPAYWPLLYLDKINFIVLEV